MRKSTHNALIRAFQYAYVRTAFGRLVVGTVFVHQGREYVKVLPLIVHGQVVNALSTKSLRPTIVKPILANVPDRKKVKYDPTDEHIY